MKTTVIVPCYNAEQTIAEQLDALARQQCCANWEVIVVDNRCTDATIEIVRRYENRLPNLRIVPAYARQGQPYALNIGIQAAQGDALLFCDADDVAADNYVATMSSALIHHDFVACGFETTRLNAPWVQNSHANLQQTSLSQYKYPPYLRHSGGGVLGVKRSLCEKFSGFDESLPMLHDTDFCWRLQLAGIALTFVPQTTVHVRYRSSISGLYRQSRGYAEYNVLLYKRYQQRGMPAISRQMRVRQWKTLLRIARGIRSQAGRARAAWQLGWCMGRLRGSIKHKVFAL